MQKSVLQHQLKRSLPSDEESSLVRKRLTLAQNIDDLIHFKRFGHCLAESYDDLEGSLWWSRFVSNDVQDNLRGTNFEYYASSHEILALEKHSREISKQICRHADLDLENVTIIEKGNGSSTAMLNKTLVQLDAMQQIGIKTRMYVAREHSRAYREEAVEFFKHMKPGLPVIVQDVDFNKEDPLIPGSEGPRIVFEFGSSRSNIATAHKDEIPYKQLYETFSHDRKVCQTGGILLMACDCNQDQESLESSFSHNTHAEFSKNIFRRGLKEGVLSSEFSLDEIEYFPKWDGERYLLKHTLVSRKDQAFKLYRKGQAYIDARLIKGEEYIYSHSFRWPSHIIEEAANRNSFRTLGIFWDDNKRVAIFLFKAI